MKSVSFYIEQENKLFAFASYEIKSQASETFKINYEKLSQTITKAIFKRYEAHKSGIKTGLKTNRPFNLTISIDNIKVFDLEELSVNAGMESSIKVNTALYKKDPNEAKAVFQRTVLFVLEVNDCFSLDVLGVVE